MTQKAFIMRPEHRALLIQRHKFLLEQGKNKVLAHLTDQARNAEASQVSNKSWNESCKNFDPDTHDEGLQAEQAENDGIWRYTLLSDFRNTMRLSIIAAFYHEWDKQLCDWLANEMKFLVKKGSSGPAVRMAIWEEPISSVLVLLKLIGLDVRSQPYFGRLEACQLVVNVYKHGPGKSFTDLKKNYPKYILRSNNSIGNDYISENSVISVSDADMDDFSCAIVDFWKSVPNHIEYSKISNFPKWLRDAAKKNKGSGIIQAKKKTP